MTTSTSKKYPELLHYTTAEGLIGILSTQTLRATHYDYLNDSGEFKYFFESRLPFLLNGCVGQALSELYFKSSEIKKIIDTKGGGVERLASHLEHELYEMLKGFNDTFFEAYLISFCGVATSDKEIDGLLSQWRAYGADGGYAIVFDSSSIFEGLLTEHNEFNHIAIVHGAVDYFDTKKKSGSGSLDKEIEEFKELISKYIMEEGKNKDTHTDLIIQIIVLASLHKHSGYYEEHEVRISSIQLSSKLPKSFNENGKKSSEVSFNTRNGLLVPYITLFRDQKLPIKRILVGPHPDNIRRKRSVDKLLNQYRINAEVVISEIPYIGKF